VRGNQAMADRIDRYLEGTLSRAELTASEHAEADLARRAIDETHAFITARSTPDLAPAILRRIEQLGLRPVPPARRSALGRLAALLWTARPVSFTVRPAYGLAAALAIVAVVIGSPGELLRGGAPEAHTAQPQLFVQFRLQALHASDVRLAGSFTDWEPRYALQQAAPGIWTVSLPLPQGVHDYVFVVDGRQWVPDPYAPRVDDGFGGTNSRIAVLTTERGEL
jgi:hypothetical protein